MIDVRSWLGLGDDQDQDDPVTRALRLLGAAPEPEQAPAQPAAGSGQPSFAPEDYSSNVIAPPMPQETATAPFQDTYTPDVGAADMSFAAPPVTPPQSPLEAPTAPQNQITRYVPSYAPQAAQVTPEMAPSSGWTGSGQAALGAVSSGAQAAADELTSGTSAAVAGLRPPETQEEVIFSALPATARAAKIVSDVSQAFGGEAGRRVAEALGYSDERTLGAVVPEGVPLVGGADLRFSPQDVGAAIGSTAADPTNWALPGSAADAAADLAVRRIVGAPFRAAGEGVRAVPGALRRAMADNAERVAAADARMAAEGSTQLPAMFGAVPDPRRGVPTVEVIQEQLDAARSAVDQARATGDLATAHAATEHVWALTDQLADALNARRALEPAIASDVGRQANPLTLTEESAADFNRALRPQDLVSPEDAANLGGPASVPRPSISLNATPGAVPAAPGSGPLASVNRALSEGIAGGVGGAVIEQGRNPDEDPRTAAARGFAAGAVGFPVATRLARGAARLAGAGAEAGGALATIGGVPSPGAAPSGLTGRALARWQLAGEKAASQAQAARAAGLAPPPTAGDWLRSIGYSGMIGPSTGLVNAIGNGFELLYALPKEAARAVARGRPGDVGDLALGLLDGFGRAGGEVLDALRGAHPGGGVESARLSQRATGGVGKLAGTALEMPMRIFSEAPDAFYRAIAESVGEHRAAGQIASEMGMTGANRRAYVEALLRDAADLRSNPARRSTSDNARRVVEEGRQLGERLTLRGEIGPAGQKIKAAMDALPFGLGNVIMPFFNTPYQMTQRALERTPYGLRMGTQPARFDRVYDATVGSAVGAGMLGLASAGLVSGSGPSDPEQRKMLQSQGWQGNSTLVAGRWVPNNAFGVWGPVLDTAGELGDALRYGKPDATGRDLGGDLATRVGKVVKNQVYLRGLADILNAMEATGEQREAYAASLAGRALPLGATARLAATATDPLERRPDPAREVGFWANVGQRVEASLPGLRQTLPAAQDVLGRPQPNPRAGLAALGPRTRQPTPDPVLERFTAAGIEIGAPKSEIAEDGVKIELSPAETRRWNELRGEELAQRTQRLIDNGALDRLPPDRRKERLEGIRADAAERADERLRREIGGSEFSRRRREAAQKAKAS